MVCCGTMRKKFLLTILHHRGLTMSLLPYKAQWLLYVPTASIFINSTFCPHSVFLCFVRTSEKQDNQCTYKHNTEARSCSHCCKGKAVSFKYCVCVCVCVCVIIGIQHAMRMSHIITCGLPDWLYNIFRNYLINGTIKQNTCVSVFSTTFLWRHSEMKWARHNQKCMLIITSGTSFVRL